MTKIVTDDGPFPQTELARTAKFFQDKPPPKGRPKLTRAAQKLARQIALRAKQKEAV